MVSTVGKGGGGFWNLWKSQNRIPVKVFKKAASEIATPALGAAGTVLGYTLGQVPGLPGRRAYYNYTGLKTHRFYNAEGGENNIGGQLSDSNRAELSQDYDKHKNEISGELTTAHMHKLNKAKKQARYLTDLMFLKQHTNGAELNTKTDNTNYRILLEAIEMSNVLNNREDKEKKGLMKNIVMGNIREYFNAKDGRNDNKAFNIEDPREDNILLLKAVTDIMYDILKTRTEFKTYLKHKRKTENLKTEPEIKGAFARDIYRSLTVNNGKGLFKINRFLPELLLLKFGGEGEAKSRTQIIENLNAGDKGPKNTQLYKKAVRILASDRDARHAFEELGKEFGKYGSPAAKIKQGGGKTGNKDLIPAI